MIRRIFGLVRRMHFRQALRNPAKEMARLLVAVARRLESRARLHEDKIMPSWVQQEINTLASIEPDLLGILGDGEAFRHFPVPVVTQLGATYRAMVAELGEGFVTHALVLPWLIRGGADRGAIYHLEALVDVLPASQIALILTEATPSPWLDRLPAGIRVLEFGRLTQGLEMADRVTLLTRLLVQMQPEIIHNINSHVAWEAYRKFGLVLRQASRICVSLFCDDHDEQGRPIGYARSYLRACAPHLDIVFCDNSVYPELWSRELGVPPTLFHVLRFPYPSLVVPNKASLPTSPAPRVLWAGRFHPQKRLDVLVAIARSMPAVTFDVHGSGETGSVQQALSDLEGLANVCLYGPFDDFSEIVRDDHSAYLFTSSWEGMPTILLDACAAGLPIVAPLVGAVADLLPASSLVADPEDVNAFVVQLWKIINDPMLRDEMRGNQYAAMAAGRTWEDFIGSLRRIESYFPVDGISINDRNMEGSGW